MTRAPALEPWNSKPIAQPKTGWIIERFARWLELLRSTTNSATLGNINDITVTTTQQISATMDIVYCSGAITLTFPNKEDYIHPTIYKNTGLVNVTLETAGSELVENAANASLPANDSYVIGFKDGNWWVIG